MGCLRTLLLQKHSYLMPLPRNLDSQSLPHHLLWYHDPRLNACKDDGILI